MPEPTLITWLQDLNALVGGLFLLATFSLVAMRQVNACLRMFIILSLLLAASAFLLSARYNNWHLSIVGLVDVITKAIIVPWLLRRGLRDEVYTRREITQVFAYLLSMPLLRIGDGETIGLNLPIGLGRATCRCAANAARSGEGCFSFNSGRIWSQSRIRADAHLVTGRA